MPARTPPPHATETDRQSRRAEPPPRLEDDCKRLMAAVLEFSALVRRPEPRREAPGGGAPSRLALGRIMQKNGLEQRHASALLTIALYGPMTITQLAERHHVAVKTASLIGVELETAGLIQRREDPTDRRRTIVTLAKGKEHVVREGLNDRAAHLQRTLERLTPEQRDGLITGLEVLAQEMTANRG